MSCDKRNHNKLGVIFSNKVTLNVELNAPLYSIIVTIKKNYKKNLNDLNKGKSHFIGRSMRIDFRSSSTPPLPTPNSRKIPGVGGDFHSVGEST